MNNLIDATNFGFGIGQAVLGLFDVFVGLIDDDRNAFRSGIHEITVGGMQAYSGYIGQPLPSADQIGWPAGPPQFFYATPPQPTLHPIHSLPVEQFGYPSQRQIMVIPTQQHSMNFPVRY